MRSAADSEEIQRLRTALLDAEARLQILEAQTIRATPDQRRHTERLFSAAFDESPEALGLSRLSDGKIVDVNREWLRLTGFSREEVIDRTVVEIGHWSDAASRQAAIRPLLQSGRLRNFETTLFLKDGSPRLMLLNGSLIDVVGEQHILMHPKDITAERMAEEALRSGELALAQANARLNEQLALYEQTENMARVGHWTALAGGKEILWSKGLHLLAGTTPRGAMPSAQARSGIHEDDLPLFVAMRQKMDGTEHEFRLWHADGSIRWLRSRMHRYIKPDGSVTDFGIVQDITAERAATHQLQEKFDFIQKITSQIPDMVFQFQARADGSIWFPFVSAAVQKMFHVSPEAARQDGSVLFSMIHPDDLASLKSSMAATSYDGANWNHEFRVRYADGTARWLMGTAVTRRETDGLLASYGAITDITERKQAEARLVDSELRFRSLTELSSDWYWELDEQFRFVRFDGYQEVGAGIRRDDIMGKTRWEVGALNMTEADWAAHRAVLQAHEVFQDLELQRTNVDGSEYWISLSGMPMLDAQGALIGYRGIGRTITDRKRVEAEIQRLAFYDALTALPNRRLLLDRLTWALTSSERSRRHGALLFIDLDNFKDLNDTLGHDVGDTLLKQVAERLLACIRESDTAARFGGDEFVILLEDLSEGVGEAADQVEGVAEKILSQLNQPYDLMGKEFSSTPSIGLTLFCGNAIGTDELLKRADVAMYQAKADGRNMLRFYDPVMQAAVVARLALDGDMRQGLQRREFLLYYQPVVNDAGRITDAEALLRWQHPVRGLVSPDEFIPLAEQTGLILPLGQWVLHAACQQLMSWSMHASTRELSVAVNVSARQFRQPDFVAQVLSILDDTGADPQHLKIELTESVLLNDMEDAIRKMMELRARGVRFALDDFGTGYSSLSYLKRLPLDQIKIDRTFVRDVLTDPNDASIAVTILALARSMELTAVAEGVESEGQYKFLVDNGCTAFQGYLFGRPVPVGKFPLQP